MVYMIAELPANLLFDAAADDETHSQAMIRAAPLYVFRSTL
jgi:hypothetical protein